MPDVDQIMVAEGDELSPGTEEVKYENVSGGGGGGGYDPDSIPDSTTDTVDDDLFITKESGGWVKKSALRIWNYIKTKLGIANSGNTFLRKDGTWATPENTTYNVVSTTANGLAPKVTDTSKFLRGDGTWGTPTATIDLSAIYPVGTIIHSTTCNTQAKVKAAYGGNSWIQHYNYVLRGASSGVTANSASYDGGADTQTVSDVASHNHTQNSHNHGYTHVVDGAAGGIYGSGSYKFTIKSATTDGKTATNIANGSSYSVSTLPKYKKVYIWERTA